MKVPKKIYLIASATVFVAGGVAVLALKPVPKEVPIKQVSSITENQKATSKEQLKDEAQTPVGTPQSSQSDTLPPAPKQTVIPAPAVQNPYVEGSSTWYTFKRRVELGRTLPGGLGSGSTWDDRAYSLGMTVDHNPEAGAVVSLGRDGVGIVDAVNTDGTVNVSYMTNLSLVLTAEKAAVSNYIH